MNLLSSGPSCRHGASTLNRALASLLIVFVAAAASLAPTASAASFYGHVHNNGLRIIPIMYPKRVYPDSRPWEAQHAHRQLWRQQNLRETSRENKNVPNLSPEEEELPEDNEMTQERFLQRWEQIKPSLEEVSNQDKK